MSAGSAKPPRPGLVFVLPSDVGFIVGLATHDLPTKGSLAWIATPTFDTEPSLASVASINDWRWPVLVPLAAAIRRRIVIPLGDIDVPARLRQFPKMRSGSKKIGWVAFTEVDGIRHELGPATDPSLPIYQIVNDVRLKEMVVSGWRPEDVW